MVTIKKISYSVEEKAIENDQSTLIKSFNDLKDAESYTLELSRKEPNKSFLIYLNGIDKELIAIYSRGLKDAELE